MASKESLDLSLMTTPILIRLSSKYVCTLPLQLYVDDPSRVDFWSTHTYLHSVHYMHSPVSLKFVTKLMLGTSDNWLMSRLSHRPSVLHWRLLDLKYLHTIWKKIYVCRKYGTVQCVRHVLTHFWRVCCLLWLERGELFGPVPDLHCLMILLEIL